MTVCEQHGFEHTAKFPCEWYETYHKLASRAHSVVVWETRPIEDPNQEGLLGMERVITDAHEAGWTGNSEVVRLDDDDEMQRWRFGQHD